MSFFGDAKYFAKKKMAKKITKKLQVFKRNDDNCVLITGPNETSHQGITCCVFQYSFKMPQISYEN